MKPVAVCLLAIALLAGCASLKAPAGADPLTGTWTGKWGPTPERQTDVTLELKWDGTNLKGTINPQSRAAELGKASFNTQTNAITMELDIKDNNGDTDHYAIQGKVDGKKMSGTWTRKNGQGDFHIAKN